MNDYYHPDTSGVQKNKSPHANSFMPYFPGNGG